MQKKKKNYWHHEAFFFHLANLLGEPFLYFHPEWVNVGPVLQTWQHMLTLTAAVLGNVCGRGRKHVSLLDLA